MAAPSSERTSRGRNRSTNSSPGGQQRSTSLSGGKVKTGHRLHGMKDNDASSSVSKQRSHHRSKSRDRRRQTPAASRKEYDTPFDDKGRCHYHRNVQLAAKNFRGGWKVMHSICPKCMEEKFEKTGGGVGGGSGDERSVRSGRSLRSATAVGGDGNTKYDNNGCCVNHAHIQVAKKGMLSGWKIIRPCPACGGADVGADDYSVKSGRSAAKSVSSRKSTRSAKSTKSRGKSSAGKASTSGRYGTLPFDADGYCCRHPNVQLAKKKTLGGFKIIHDVCPDCTEEDGGGGGMRRKGSRGGGRSKSRDRRGSSRSGQNDHDNDVGSGGSDAGASTTKKKKKKKRIRVRNLKTEDENGSHARYSGYVNDDHQPHGQGTMMYEDGSEWEGVWNEGSQVHGKLKKKNKHHQDEQVQHAKAAKSKF